MTPRYAIYYAPEEGTELHDFGRRWLGRDAISGEACPQDLPDGISEETFGDLTKAPGHYGFHGTLKPPFRLISGATREALECALAEFCKLRQPVIITGLRLVWLDDFLAMTPARSESGLHDLADDCVRVFDPFRNPPGEAELRQRRMAGLTPRQDRYLLQWGYPYVMEAFRFHLTLSGRIFDPDIRARLFEAAAGLTESFLNRPLKVDSICLFFQNDTASPFIMVDRFRLGAARQSSRPGKPL